MTRPEALTRFPGRHREAAAERPGRLPRWGAALLCGVAALVAGPASAQTRAGATGGGAVGLEVAELASASPLAHSGVVVGHQHIYEYSPTGTPQRAFCFAPGTSSEYIELVAAAIGGGTSVSPPSSSPGLAQFQFQDSQRWDTTVTNGAGLQQGDPTTLTWSLVPDGTPVDGLTMNDPKVASDLVATMSNTGNFPGGFAQAFALLKQGFDNWEQLTGIDFVFVHNGDGRTDDGATFPTSAGSSTPGSVRGDIRLGGRALDGLAGTLAFNFFPNNGDGVVDTADASNFASANNFRAFRATMSHELGHAIALEHVCPGDGSKLMEPMAEASLDGPEFDDILGGQRGYGDRRESNDTSGSATDLGTIAAAQTRTVGELNIPQGPVGNEDPVTIDDDGDVDFYRFTTTAARQRVTITMTPSGQPYQQGAQVGMNDCTGAPTALYDPRAQLNLALDLIGSDGTTLIAAVDQQGAGGTEVLADATLASPGTYYVRVRGAGANTVQMYHLSLRVTSSSPSFVAPLLYILD